ncbi:MAG TPA: DUF3466 family protein [Pyrinomonadaceae bacterium]|nr:DUF3466 family protein [Pyrinomonadaceae bacterium]
MKRISTIIKHLLMMFVLIGAAEVARAQYSEANAINNSGTIAGGTCISGCEFFKSFVLHKNDFQTFATLGGPASDAFGINDAGEIVGQADTDQIDLEAGGAFISLAFFIDRDGVVHNLGTLSGYKYSQAFAINNTGLIVGRVYNGNPEDPVAPMRAVIYEDGVMRQIGTLGGTSSMAFAVNDLGSVVGAARTTSGEQHAFLYYGGVMHDLDTLGGNLSTARGINSRGQIVGGSRLAIPGQRHAFVFEFGVMRDLGTLGGNFSEAFAINDSGQIVGQAETATGERHAFLYTNGRMVDLGTLGGTFSVAFAINNRGEIVGQSETTIGDFHAFLYKDGVMIDLGGD